MCNTLIRILDSVIEKWESIKISALIHANGLDVSEIPRTLPPLKMFQESASESDAAQVKLASSKVAIISEKKKEKKLEAPPSRRVVKAKDPCQVIPSKVATQIFSYLNFYQLEIINRVSKRWSEFSNIPILWQSLIYRDFAIKFYPKSEVVTKDVIRDEIQSLSENIRKEIKIRVMRGRRIKNSYILVRIPQGMSLITFGAVLNIHLNDKHTHYKFSLPCMDKIPGKPMWVFMEYLKTPGGIKYFWQRKCWLIEK